MGLPFVIACSIVACNPFHVFWRDFVIFPAFLNGYLLNLSLTLKAINYLAALKQY